MWAVKGTCLKCGESTTLRLDGYFSRIDVEVFAGILDGTSPPFVNPPNDDSQIGRRGLCGGRFRCEVIEP